MEKEFLPKNFSLEMKELGFDEPCYAYYQKEILKFCVNGTSSNTELILAAPLYQQAFKWFRDNHNLYCEIGVDKTLEPKFCFEIYKYDKNNGWKDMTNKEDWGLYLTHDEAKLECIKRLINFVKDKKS